MVNFTEKELGIIICVGSLGLMVIYKLVFEIAKVIFL